MASDDLPKRHRRPSDSDLRDGAWADPLINENRDTIRKVEALPVD